MNQEDYINSPKKGSYSKLMLDLENGRVESILLVPARREVLAKYKDGTTNRIPILRNDQLVLKTAQRNNIPITVKDIRKEQAAASLFGNITFILILRLMILFIRLISF